MGWQAQRHSLNGVEDEFEFLCFWLQHGLQREAFDGMYDLCSKATSLVFSEAPADETSVGEDEDFAVLPPREPPRFNKPASALWDAESFQCVSFCGSQSEDSLDLTAGGTGIGAYGQ